MIKDSGVGNSVLVPHRAETPKNVSVCPTIPIIFQKNTVIGNWVGCVEQDIIQHTGSNPICPCGIHPIWSSKG